MRKLLLSFGLLLGLTVSALSVVSTTPVGDAAYTILATDTTVITTVTLTGSRIWTLPSAGATNIGQGIPGQGPGGANALNIIDVAGAVSVADPIVLIPASGETINNSSTAITIAAPYTKVTLTPTNGSNWAAMTSSADVQVFQTAGAATWTSRKGISWVQVLACGAGGGGGGGGAGVASGTAWGGGAGGGGGACILDTFRASDLGASQVLTIGAAATAATNSQSGTVGGNTCFGGTSSCGGTPLIQAYGGGGGSIGLTGAGGTGGGAGGGFLAVGTSVSASGTGGAAVFAGAAGGTALVGANSANVGGGAGGGGGTAAGAAGVAGGNSIFSAPGGGSGGGVTTGPAATNGGAGGASPGCLTAAAGGTAGASPSAAGGSLAADYPYHVGCGGGGGASALLLANIGGAGGAGTHGGGGGGGGAACTSAGSCTATATSFTGGKGGDGFIVVTSW